MLTPEMESKMAKDRVEYLKGDPNANNAEKGVKNAELEKAQWEKEAKGAVKPEVSKPSPPKSEVAFTSDAPTMGMGTFTDSDK